MGIVYGRLVPLLINSCQCKFGVRLMLMFTTVPREKEYVEFVCQNPKVFLMIERILDA